MKKMLLLAAGLFSGVCFAQSVSQQLQKAFQSFENDPQLKYAISSLHVIDAKTGKTVFTRNAGIGLAPASTQKVITSVTAFELLGKDFRYKTTLALDRNDPLTCYIIPSGDPTFGSDRWEHTKGSELLKRIVTAIRDQKISSIRWDTSGWNSNSIPDGWIWQDLGNYYGAGADKLNWRENQYDIFLRSGKTVGDPVTVVRTDPTLFGNTLHSNLVTAKKGSGDNAFIYFAPGNSESIIRGTIPLGEDKFRISGAFVSGARQFASELAMALSARTGMDAGDEPSTDPVDLKTTDYRVVYTHYSSRLDSIIYWFNKKSINLYGEALVRSMAFHQSKPASTDSGITVIRRFWEGKGLDGDELNISDGSGLSPQNRITTRAQVEILRYARGKVWYPQFLNALPEYNGMRMKSGTIRDVKGYCGYHKSKDGTEYIFSFLVNNYRGSSSALVSKIYKVLDVLK